MDSEREMGRLRADRSRNCGHGRRTAELVEPVGGAGDDILRVTGFLEFFVRERKKVIRCA